MYRLIAIAMLIGALAQLGRAATLYDTTGGGLHNNSFGPAPILDDMSIAGGPVTISLMDFAYVNYGSTAEDVDAVVTFWDNMNTAATGATTVNGSSLGSFTRHIGSIPGNGTGVVGLFVLPSAITIPDGNFGVEIEYVFTGTSDLSDVEPRLSNILPTTGSTIDKYWSRDQNPNATFFAGSDAVNQNFTNTGVHENLYLRLDGSVPEPASAVGFGVLAGLMKLRRQRRAAAAA